MLDGIERWLNTPQPRDILRNKHGVLFICSSIDAKGTAYIEELDGAFSQGHASWAVTTLEGMENLGPECVEQD